MAAGVIYAGTDDGQVQMTTNGGKSWQNLTSRFRLAGERWVSRVLASRHGAGTAYAAFDGHQDDDFKPYIFRTTDSGASWKSIAGDIPQGIDVNALEEHPRNSSLLFAGTEFGLFVTVNGGANWTHVRGSLPTVPIDDIILNEKTNDLVLGTHGRSIIVLDDVAVLEHLTPQRLTDESHMFPLRPATQYYEARQLPVPGASDFAGPNPEYGALITYYLRTRGSEDERNDRHQRQWRRGRRDRHREDHRSRAGWHRRAGAAAAGPQGDQPCQLGSAVSPYVQACRRR